MVNKKKKRYVYIVTRSIDCVKPTNGRIEQPNLGVCTNHTKALWHFNDVVNGRKQLEARGGATVCCVRRDLPISEEEKHLQHHTTAEARIEHKDFDSGEVFLVEHLKIERWLVR